MIEREIKKLELQNGIVPFDDWFDSLRDKRMQAAVDARLARVRAGNFGDAKSVGGGVSELRINFGPDFAFITVCTAGKSWCCWAVATKAASPATSAARSNTGNNS